MEKEIKKYCTAIILSAGQGKRMGTSIQKQYIELGGKPLICHTIEVFEKSEVIDDIVLVAGEGQETYVRREIVEKYGFQKISAIVTGGKERYDSLWCGLRAVSCMDGYVFIHDGARMFVDEEILKRAYETVKEYKACVAGMPSKDTVKVADERGFAIETPERKYVWTVQTPQVFEISLIKKAYAKLMEEQEIQVTDDAMVVEQMLGMPVRLFEASYRNIKITTPEDLEIAKVFLYEKDKNNKK